MKKKILILIMCVCMIVPLFAFVSFADTASALIDNWNYQYGVVTGYFYRDGTGGTDSGTADLQFGGGIGNARVYLHLNSGDRSFEFDTLHYDYDYLTLSVGSSDVDRVEISLTSSNNLCFYAIQLLGDTLTVTENGNNLIEWDVSDEPCKYTLVMLYNDSAVLSGSVDSFFPNDNDVVSSVFTRLTQLSLPHSIYKGSNYHVSEPSNLIELMLGSVGITGIGLASGIKEGVSNLIYVNPDAETKTLSNFAIFIFIIAGLSIAMTVFWLVFRLIRFGRQR